MNRIFISHSSTNKEVADELVRFLEGRGIPCFIAPRDVERGQPYARVLMRAIRECEMVILIASAAINESEHVLNEVEQIVREKKTMIPILIEDFELSDELRYHLSRKQRITAFPEKPEAYFERIFDAIAENLPMPVPAAAPAPEAEAEETEEEENVAKTTVFTFDPKRGIMINPEDHQRNVSFRTDTFVNMMGGIYEKVEALAGTEAAESIFFESGYVSGKNFADRIDNQWDAGSGFQDIKNKMEKWCRFDSAVGWGKFSSTLSIDEENDCLSGTVCIDEAFIVDHKKKRKICGFIRGYCTGVAEVLLKSDEVELTCRDCPLKSKYKTQCVFDLKAK